MPKIVTSIVHIESYIEFEHFFNLIRPESFLYDGHFIMIYDRADAQEIENMFHKLWKAYIYNVIILTTTNPKSSNLVSVFTYMPFANYSCNSTKSVQINEFNKTSMKWTTNVFFPKKFKQMNRCPIKFGCYVDSPGVIINSGENGLKIFGGMNIDITIMISDILNFTLNVLEYEQGMGVIFSNNSATKILKKVLDNEVDVIMGSIQKARLRVLDATRWVYADKLVLVVTPSLLIDPIQKIFLPFTFASWISIAMVALLACCIIKLLKFSPKIVHDYVIGSNVKGSMLNVWNVLLGGNQQMLPQSNFPRFLLVKFLIFTMIMRNLYQGGVFDILKRDVRGVELTTVDEFIEHEFTFYVYPSLADRLKGSKLLQRFVTFCRINFH
ncbi:uncharacterized protein LOC119081089 [Bradysia coprophila]|uniref:uncharacterized protein LOC119081089 n=1 Tax=Bradysia coprophila TaxID=38358 RepID=UPI00187DC797|nr:uncharacterized protein LOC119081089 [Bradysia coprophila]